jgi:predicted RNA binding protein YcfA (HicA-like mRNA interferase family)
MSQSGSHLKMFNPETKRTAIIPIHGNKQIPIGSLKAIEKQVEKQANIKFLNKFLNMEN